MHDIERIAKAIAQPESMDLAALTRFIEDAELPPDNNHIENHIRPIALGRPNWLLAASLRGGQRAAAVAKHR